METTTLNVTPREKEGALKPGALRRTGLMPAVVYGQGKKPQMLSIDMNEFKNLLNHITNQSLIALNADGDAALSDKIVMIKELQRHPVTQRFIHADFYEVDMTKTIKVMIPIVAVGECPGEEIGGTLQIIRRELEVSCLPGDIPESIELDVSELNIGDSIHISAIKTGEKAQLTWDPDYEPDYTVLAVAAPTAEEEPEEEELEEGEKSAEGTEGEGEESSEKADEDSGDSE